MTKFSFIIISLALSVNLLSARTVRTIFLKPPASAPEQAYLYDGKSSVRVSLPSRNLSPAEKLSKGLLEISILPSAIGEDGELPAGAQKIKIPEAWDEVILIFIPSTKNRLFPAKVRALNASKGNLKMGETLVYNLSPTLFIGQLGKSLIKVKPNRYGIAKPPLKVSGTYPVAIDCVLANKERRAVIRSTWIHNMKARRILFVIPSEGKDLPRVWGVLDRSKEAVK